MRAKTRKESMAKKNEGMSAGQKVSIGAGLTALAAAAAGAYYFYGSKNAAKNRKALKSWAVKAQGEVMERIEQMQEVTQDAYDKAVTQVMKGYRTAKKIAPAELNALENSLREQWSAIAKTVKTAAPRAKAPAKRKK